VRFCREVPGTGELGVFARGDRSVIATFPGTTLDNSYSMNVADLCPVGALTTKDFRFRVRVWDLEDVDGICTGCSRGCNIHISVGKKRREVYRYRPRRNEQVNGTWMCDAGRLSYTEIGRPDRLAACLVRSPEGALEERPLDVAVATAARRLRALIEAKGAGVVCGVASAHASNEDLYTFKRLLDALEIEMIGVPVVSGTPDSVLLEAERAPNAFGARALGFGDALPLAERVRGGGADGLIVLGHDLLDSRYLGGIEPLERLETIIAMDRHHSPIDRVAAVVLAARHPAEKECTFTNSAGHVQQVQPAVAAADGVRSEGETLTLLGAALELPGFEEPWDVRAVSRAMARDIAAFRGLHLGSVGPMGAASDPVDAEPLEGEEV
jgi:NADH-quinone oxidoreductase subunit G